MSTLPLADYTPRFGFELVSTRPATGAALVDILSMNIEPPKVWYENLWSNPDFCELVGYATLYRTDTGPVETPIVDAGGWEANTITLLELSDELNRREQKLIRHRVEHPAEAARAVLLEISRILRHERASGVELLRERRGSEPIHPNFDWDADYETASDEEVCAAVRDVIPDYDPWESWLILEMRVRETHPDENLTSLDVYRAEWL